MMTTKQAEAVAGSLTKTSKMPGASYSLPAKMCPTFHAYRGCPEKVCAHCYATRGRYMFKNVTDAQKRRWKALEDPGWEDAMDVLIKASRRLKNGEWFRWHDSGSVKNTGHMISIFRLAMRNPDIHFWLPYRVPCADKHLQDVSVAMLRDASAACEGIPDNLTIRFSAEDIDRSFDVPETLEETGIHVVQASVYTCKPPEGAYPCPATLPGGPGECGNCRACWSKGVPHVSYRKH